MLLTPCRYSLGVVLAATLLASPAGAESITEALASAYWNNPTINSQRAETRAVDENVPIAKAGNRPQVSAYGEIDGTHTGGYARSGRVGADFSRNTSDLAVGVQVQQNLFNGFQTRNAVSGATSNVYASRFALESTVQDVLLDAAQAYMDVLRDEALLRLRRQNIDFLDEQLRAAQDRFDVGENTRTDVAQTRAELSLAQSNLSLAEANLVASKAIYRQVVGHEANNLQLTFPFRNKLPSSLQQALSLSLDRHPSIIAAQYAMDAAAYDAKRIEGELLPTVSVTGNLQKEIGVGRPDNTETAQIIGRVSIPIYQGGSVSARVRQAKELLGQRRIEVDVAREQVRASTVAAWGTLEATNASILAATAQVAASDIALQGVIEEQRVGQRTQLDVLDARSTLLDANVNRVVSQRDRIVAAFSLLAAVGRLNADALNLPVERYHAEAHYEAVKDKWFGLRTPDGR
ncbi:MULTISPECIES: TolC family outer membrane protein [Afifella]|uniref:TolC family outer membrane protein n=1 Tax=Afifella TaxID=643217 RepID=UPI000FE350F0|nr:MULTISPECIES: TolC family outer membrane protein [Afifella]MCT8265753.1 TolC family outer membrane protein [Afifella sp. JA880]